MEPTGLELVEAERRLADYKQKRARISELQKELDEIEGTLFPVEASKCVAHLHHTDYCTQESFMGFGSELCLLCGDVIHI